MTLATATRSTGPSPTVTDIIKAVKTSVADRRSFAEPYPHYLVDGLFPKHVADELADLPFAAPALDGVSGKRELHNDTRSYFDEANMGRFPVMADVAEALQTPEVIALFSKAFDAPLDNTYLRLEYAQDIDGFWLEPHTDLGVKKFTCLIYLSQGPGHELLGTDIYASKEQHFGTSPFIRNAAMIFVPGANTWHGFEKRPITGVRKSVILNYVTPDWRAREQLSFPDQIIRT
ncbi:2OG-Fe(II) oxygenase [Lichenifustis flavocetrariae]|uniref:2OG-Fe(II) oxygenase n=1 Tax=Lichenifustis flavocetrariae TaxID=2949735 RepID=A0AA41Z1J6_9HYPH|nr:2OG-Fe(II) oxygenase [Lichenifustis flavocetrariae]MCW6511145.1 2OG-Fe(II) oxygenase [Lichenifustis flavocetrariae]